MKEDVEIPQVIKDLKSLFEIPETITADNCSTVFDGKFMIDKRVFLRDDVMQKLSNYFSDKNVKGGYVTVDPLTFVHTSFEVKEGAPKGY